MLGNPIDSEKGKGREASSENIPIGYVLFMISIPSQAALSWVRGNRSVRTVDSFGRALDRLRMPLTNSFAGISVDVCRVSLPHFIGMIGFVEHCIGWIGNLRSTNVLFVLIGGNANKRGFPQKKTFTFVTDQRQRWLIGKEHVC